jgi:hypothetical protein
MNKALAAAALACALAMPAVASAQDQYLDNRSDAASLVRSLYNAVNRKEYARAWDYYGDQKPAKSYDKFVQGYADTQRVDVATGAVSEEGAAGSIYYSVPVAIRATDSKGDQKTFAGCYTARLSQPAIQEPPFKPMHIEKGSLKPADGGGSLSNDLPESCGDAPPTKADTMRDQIVEAFKVTYGAICQTLEPDAEPGAADPEVTVLKFKYPGSEDESESQLFKFECITGAYNTGQVFYLANSYEFRQLHFAEPELDIRYQDGDQQTKLDSMTITGWTTSDQLVNSFYDDKEMSLTSFSKWRGVGDQSSTGKYRFRNGDFALVHYDVDPTGDGEINPEPVVNLDEAP